MTTTIEPNEIYLFETQEELDTFVDELDEAQASPYHYFKSPDAGLSHEENLLNTVEEYEDGSRTTDAFYWALILGPEDEVLGIYQVWSVNHRLITVGPKLEVAPRA